MPGYAQTNDSWTWGDKTNPPQPTGTFSAFSACVQQGCELIFLFIRTPGLYFFGFFFLQSRPEGYPCCPWNKNCWSILHDTLIVSAVAKKRGKFFTISKLLQRQRISQKTITMLNKHYRGLFFSTIANQLQACAGYPRSMCFSFGDRGGGLAGAETARVNSTNWLSQLD